MQGSNHPNFLNEMNKTAWSNLDQEFQSKILEEVNLDWGKEISKEVLGKMLFFLRDNFSSNQRRVAGSFLKFKLGAISKIDNVELIELLNEADNIAYLFWLKEILLDKFKSQIGRLERKIDEDGDDDRKYRVYNQRLDDIGMDMSLEVKELPKISFPKSTLSPSGYFKAIDYLDCGYLADQDEEDKAAAR